MTVKMLAPDPIDLGEIDRAIHEAMTKLVDEADKAFQLSYLTWEKENQPVFSTKQYDDMGALVVEYSTEATPYVWVDDGTDPHTIAARFAPALKFTVDSTPKTFPNNLYSFAGSPGSDWRGAHQVNHPGIAPRDFSGQVAQRMDGLVLKFFDDAFARVRSL